MKDLFTNSQPSIVDSNRILYTSSSFARSSLLHLQEVGELKALRSHQSNRSGLDSFLFFTVISGSGTLSYNQRNYNLISGDCVFIDCNIPYTHSTDDSNLWTLRWIHFNGPNLHAIYDKYCERGGRPAFTPVDEAGRAVDSPIVDKTLDYNSDGKVDSYSNRVNAVWSSLFETAGSHDYMRDMMINQELSTLLTLLMEESWHPEDQESLPPKKMVVGSVKDYLDQNYGKKITLDLLSKRFFIDKYYLTKTFKEQYGQSITAYLQTIRITKAKQMLRFTDKTVEEIGFECGLGAPHYFSQRFKEVEGVPPSKYREQW